MFLAHFAAAFAAKRLAPRASLGTLFMAAQWLDLVWPVFLLLGIEQARIEPGNTVATPLAFTHYPWSHSLAMALVWGGAFGGLYAFSTRRFREAAVLAMLVPGHWLLDVLVHAPDLPLWPDGPAFGLRLWDAPGLVVSLEFAALLGGVALWRGGVRAKDRAGAWIAAALVACLALIQIGNAAGTAPPSIAVVAWVGLAQWLLVFWAFRVDRHFQSREVSA